MTDGSSDAAAGSGEAADTREAILEATYRALCAHGYADLTMRDIAEETETSKASLHYHYDTKEELMLAFLEYLYDEFTAEYGEVEGGHAVERLVALVDGILDRSEPECDEAFETALLELKAQAPYVEAYREAMERFDAFLRQRVRDLVAAGKEEGTIRGDVDADDTAAFVATLVAGVITRRVSIGGTDGGARRTVLEYLRERVVAPDADVRVDG